MTAYVESFAKALPTKKRIAQVRAELEAAGVEYVLSSWIDLFGIPKTKPVPMTAVCRSLNIICSRAVTGRL